jgi:hypothetical protein
MRWLLLRWWWRAVWRERLPMWVARHLPPRICYFAFIRVHAASEADWTFVDVARTWEARYRLEE